MIVQELTSHDCIGALDGTHVKARLPQGQEIPYIGRKGYPTQNILVGVDFNMCFIFAWAGWEGAAHDSRIFGEALRRPELNFPRPIGNKYYLVDAGYPHMKGYMAPYKGDNMRYHLAQFRRGATRQLREPEGELKNVTICILLVEILLSGHLGFGKQDGQFCETCLFITLTLKETSYLLLWSFITIS
uniref:Uncharacterized protein LOC104244544 isoform X2 n=1 Tax=Nicotiana sylvestris TaxID=4096 RepID=A0A1U7Y581_NICSY|nr:PREDICTED: uncharacterized protein LOC104244544 isoform X2 [Nicotiana sylvestris]